MRTCTVEACESRAASRGLCPKHHARLKKYGNTDKIRSRWDGHVKQAKPCEASGCDQAVMKGRYCGKHRQRLHRHGSLDTVLPKHRTYGFREELFDTWAPESAWAPSRTPRRPSRFP